MTYGSEKLDRRQFLKFAAAGAVATAVYSPAEVVSTTETPVRGGTLTCGFAFLIQTPDPHRYTGEWARQCSAPSYEGLTSPTPFAERLRIQQESGPEAEIPEVQPMLAENWEIEKGGQRYVFHLKKGVKFHNGKDLEAKDVAWNWKRIQDPIHISATRQFLTLYLDSIETPDNHTW